MNERKAFSAASAKLINFLISLDDSFCDAALKISCLYKFYTNKVKFSYKRVLQVSFCISERRERELPLLCSRFRIPWPICCVSKVSEGAQSLSVQTH